MLTRRCLGSLFFLLFTVTGTLAQPLYRYLDWTGNDYCYDAEKLLDGRIAALVESKDSNLVSDACIVFIDAFGNFKSRTRLLAPLAQSAKAIAPMPDSGYVICGSSSSATNGLDIFTARFDKNDSVLWTQTFVGSQNDEPQDIQVTPDGQILVCGYTRSYGPSGFNSLLLKYDRNGNLGWSRVFSTSTFDAGFRILVLGNHYYVSTNINTSSTFGKGDLHLMKLDSAGTPLWISVYGTGENEIGWNMIRSLDNQIVFTMASSSAAGNKQIIIAKIDTTGKLLFQKRLTNGNDALDVFDVVQDPDSSYCVVGHTFTASSLIHSLVIRVDKAGNPIHAKRSNFSITSELWRLIPLGAYRYLCFGHGDDQGSAGSKLLLMSGDSSLLFSCQQWQPMPLSLGSENINQTKANLFSFSEVGSSLKQTWKATQDLIVPSVLEKNQNSSINSLLPSTKELCTIDSSELDAGNFSYYLWDNGAITRKIKIDTFRKYRVRVYSQGCFNVDSTELVKGIPAALQLSSDTCGRDSLLLQVQPQFGHSYSWSHAPNQYQGYAKQEGLYFLEDDELARNCTTRDSIYVQLSANSLELIMDSLSPCLTNNRAIIESSIQYTLAGDSLANSFWYQGGSQINQGPVISHQASQAGIQALLFIAKSTKGCIDSAQIQYRIHPQPIPNFTLSDSQICYSKLPVDIKDFSSIEQGNFTRKWFIDSTYHSNSSSFQLASIQPGIHTISIELISDSSCTSTLNKTLRVYASPLAKIHSTSLNPQCLNENEFAFIDSSSWIGSPDNASYSWKSDKKASVFWTGNSAFVNFEDSGNSVLTMIIESEHGCIDSSTYPVTILASPYAKLFVSDTLFCAVNGLATLRNQSHSGNPFSSRLYAYNGDSILNFSNLTTNILDTGQFDFRLAIRSSNSCTDEDTVTISIAPLPDFDFKLDALDSCLNSNSVQVSYSINGGSFSSFIVDYADGNSENAGPFKHSYTQIGTRNILGIASNSYGCRDTQNIEITIHPNPKALFQVEPKCLGDSSAFASESIIEKGEIISWLWNLGDGATKDGEVVYHIYLNPGDYDVSLNLISDQGCTDSLKLLAHAKVRDVVPARFVIDTLQVGYDYDQFQFIGLNENATEHHWEFSSGESFYDRIVDYSVRDSAQVIVKYTTLDSFGCVSTFFDTLLFDFNRLVAIPNAFTPDNKDDLNDEFIPIGIKFNDTYTFIIINRWGEIIFESHDPAQGWDGTFRGVACMEDIYVYQIDIDHGKYQYYGTVHLLR